MREGFWSLKVRVCYLAMILDGNALTDFSIVCNVGSLGLALLVAVVEPSLALRVLIVIYICSIVH